MKRCSSMLPVFVPETNNINIPLFTPCPNEHTNELDWCDDCVSAMNTNKERVVLLDI